jgi:hypothetical protein
LQRRLQGAAWRSGDDDDLAADPAGFAEAVDIREVGQRA